MFRLEKLNFEKYLSCPLSQPTEYFCFLKPEVLWQLVSIFSLNNKHQNYDQFGCDAKIDSHKAKIVYFSENKEKLKHICFL